MNKIFNYLLIISLVIIITPFFSFGQSTSNGNFLEISIIPKNPEPFQTVKTTIKSSLYDLDRSKITWLVDGLEKNIEYANQFLKAIREKCDEHCALLIFDEIQNGFGRSGTLFAFEQTGVIPDVLLLAKGMGGGMPIGCIVSSQKLLNEFTYNPVLGNINTFGGNAVCCAASLACLQTIVSEKLVDGIETKSNLIRSLLKHQAIKSVKGKGLMLSLEFENTDLNFKIIETCIKNGLIVDWFLFNTNSMRITPPLIITEEEIKTACAIILKSIDEVVLLANI